jgi:hypothetical protein
MKLTDLEIPVTLACRAALEVATAYCSPALLNHEDIPQRLGCLARGKPVGARSPV